MVNTAKFNKGKKGAKGKGKFKGKPQKDFKKFKNRIDANGNQACNKCGGVGHLYKNCPDRKVVKK